MGSALLQWAAIVVPVLSVLGAGWLTVIGSRRADEIRRLMGQDALAGQHAEGTLGWFRDQYAHLVTQKDDYLVRVSRAEACAMVAESAAKGSEARAAIAEARANRAEQELERAQQRIEELEDRVGEYFEETYPVPFMEKVYTIKKEVREKIKIPENVYKASSTAECPSGTKGRLAVFEVIEMNKELENAILKTPNSTEIEKLVRSQGVFTMKEDAIFKAFDKKIPFEEVSKL